MTKAMSMKHHRAADVFPNPARLRGSDTGWARRQARKFKRARHKMFHAALVQAKPRAAMDLILMKIFLNT